MAFDPSIIMGYRGMGELPNPMNQLAQVSQIQAAQQQGQMNQMKIEEMLAERKEIDATAAALKDKGYTPQTYFEMMVSSRNPERQKVGAEGLFRLKRQADFQSQFGPALGKMFGEPTAAPAETPAAGTFAADTAARRTAMAPAAPVNAMAPASVNAMAPATAAARQPASINQMEQMAMQLGQYEDVPGAKTVANLLEKKLEAARKITSGAPGHVLYQNGVAISTVPEKDSEFEKLLKNSGLSDTEKTALRIARAKKEAMHAPGTTVNVSTEKKYGESLAGKIADRDDAKLGAAEKAPQLAESANRIIDLVKQGDLFTGPIADIKLNVARGLNVLGADNNAKIANTELLIAATGQSTLDAIKGAGLGTNQGFTDKDLKFLQGIAGGTIDLTAQTLTRLATLQHQAATRSAESWNTRVKQLPKSATEGTGLSMEPIKVPPLSPNTMFAVNPKTGARIQSVDGGANWTPVGGK